MAQAFKEPMVLVSRYLSSSPRRSGSKLLSSNSPTKRQKSTRTSKVLPMLDSLELGTPSEDPESDIEILGPFSILRAQNYDGHEKGKDSKRVNKKFEATGSTDSKPVHPFFMQPKAPVDALEDVQMDWLAEQMAPKIGGSKVSPKPQVEQTTVKKAKTTAKAGTPKSSSSSSISAGDMYSFQDYTNPKPVLVYTKHEDEANDLIDGLKPGPLAFDIEWRVFFRRKSASSTANNVERRSSVVQLADTSGLILVIQVYDMPKFPKNLQALIENPKIPKMGANILNDGKKLFRDYGILARGLVELGPLALFADPAGTKEQRKIISLAKLTARYCQKELNKGQVRTGNWEAELGSTQLEYAGNDVHSATMIYQRLVEIAEERGVELNIFDPAFSSEVVVNFAPPEQGSSSDHISEQASQNFSTASSDKQNGAPRSLRTDNGGDAIMRPQHLRAYRYWHDQGMSLAQMCLVLSTKGKLAQGVVGEPLKIGTVISYVIGALQCDPQLPFKMSKLRDLVQSDGTSWVRHREWILKTWAEGRGVQD